MSEEKVASEVVDAEIVRICEQLGATLGVKEREIVKREMVAGRLDFDAEKESFRYKLKAPVEREKGAITEVSLREPSGGQLRDAFKGGREDMDSSLHLLSLVTGQTLVVIEAMKQRDIGALSACLGFFG